MNNKNEVKWLREKWNGNKRTKELKRRIKNWVYYQGSS
jgi:hypothetical protein